MNGAASANVLIEAVSTQELDDMYQDVDSEEFSEFGSDIDEQEEGEADIPALERLNKEVQATFSDEDIDEMIAYLKEEGMISWIKEYVTERKTPVLILLAALGAPIPLNAQKEPHSDQNMLHRLLKVTLTRILRRRSKLEHINTPEDIVELIKKSKNIIVLTGAGISVSCGIPDFRSSSGIYAQINESNNYELDDPQQMLLEDRDVLLRNYTQNIDTLETEVGVTRVLQCHGSFATATCIECKTKVNGSDLKEDIFSQRIPLCKICNKPVAPAKGKPKSKKKDVWNPKQKDADDDMDIPTPPLPKGIMKPDIIFFGEPLNDEFDYCLFKDRNSVDLLLVIGTSLKVAPVSEILTHIPHSVPQVLINKTPVTHVNPDVVLLGDADCVIEYLCDKLTWTLPGVGSSNKAKVQARLPGIPIKPVKAYNHEHVWVFPGGEGESWALKDPIVKSVPSIVPSRPDSATSSIRKRLSNESLRPALDRKDTDRSTKKSRLI
ncbi:NAD-dependent histone deacetylase SIR2 [Rhizoctonia solani]|uniref:NAD-dependent histone deacetylase SIR2 n=1 Tax=Rhizoctonia solani TaxID=456999 RepID=A0A8H8NR61_9AGAM|nr:NAD-dependent histone deacetylase SIR2 [Rhizoctonia solani]QRW16941.1 NAD-dependent histone deacetylase SIR2 [Rhizoctonia solani]